MRRGGGSDRASHTAALLTAAVSLATIPIVREIFWGLHDDGGIIVGTMLTLLFLPALNCVVPNQGVSGPRHR
jgi:hypothetical protein